MPQPKIVPSVSQKVDTWKTIRILQRFVRVQDGCILSRTISYDSRVWIMTTGGLRPYRPNFYARVSSISRTLKAMS